MIRQTSADAYNEIKQSGLLGQRQKYAYDILYKHGPLTGNELSDKMGIPGQWKRCNELKKRDLAVEVGERHCRVTGVNCIIWDVTRNLPVKPEKKKTKQDIIKEQATSILQLKERVRFLEGCLEQVGMNRQTELF